MDPARSQLGLQRYVEFQNMMENLGHRLAIMEIGSMAIRITQLKKVLYIMKLIKMATVMNLRFWFSTAMV